MPEPQEKPRFRVYRRFRIGVIAWRHPVRLLSWLLAVLLLFPEISRFVDYLEINTGALLKAAILFLSFFLFFGWLLLIRYIEYRRFPVLFYDDRLEMRDSLLLRENLKIPYRNILEMRCVANPVQKLYGIQSLCLNLKTSSQWRESKDYWYELGDFKNAAAIEKRLSSLMHV